ncbi:unnamed protein product [Owenia fusiformis]|uniref:Hemoglobin linker chain n=1 Tax=Owenia fusiformis TaxID=6347 RepID=A0A8S4PMM3_OWEFU|nr:unnamed protein product [Owenia fusiformis]
MATRFILVVVVVLCIYNAGRVRASCDCKLSATSKPVAPEIINSRLDAQEAIINIIKEKYKKLQQDNQVKLERLKNSKRDGEHATDIVYTEGTARGTYSFMDNKGRKVEGILKAIFNYNVASRLPIWKITADKFKITGYTFMPYFLASTPISGRVRASCDCKLSATSKPVAPEIINSSLDYQQEIIDRLEKQYQNLVQNNEFNLERLTNAKTDAQHMTDIAYKEANQCAKKRHLRCIESGECIHQLFGCDGVVDCLDGSDEDNTVCMKPFKIGGKFRVVLPKSQQCFHNASSFVQLVTAVTKLETIKYFPQIFKGAAETEYTFIDNQGRNAEGILKVKFTHFVASGEMIWKHTDEEHNKYNMTGYGFLPYFIGPTTPIRGTYYFGHDLKKVCSDVVWYPHS